MYLTNKNQNGIGLVEVVAALGISVIVLTALVSLALFTLRSSLQSKLQLEGSKLANRELELFRAYRDGSDSWALFMNTVFDCTQESPCHMTTTGNIGVGSGSFIDNPGEASQITRYFYVTKPDGNPSAATDNEVRVYVVVSWDIGGDAKFARLYSDLTNWKNN